MNEVLKSQVWSVRGFWKEGGGGGTLEQVRGTLGITKSGKLVSLIELQKFIILP